MGLDFGQGLFGEGLFDSSAERIFTLVVPNDELVVVAPGWAVTGNVTTTAGGAQKFQNCMGFLTQIELHNESGASRNCTYKVENLTSAVELISSNTNVADEETKYIEHVWSIEDIKSGDSIKLSIGNEGVATAKASKTYYYSIPGLSFKPDEPVTDSYEYWQGAFEAKSNLKAYAPVSLPHGAVVTNVKVYGNDTSETWYLRRCPIGNGRSGTEMATNTMNSADSSISHATIDNVNYSYIFATGLLNDTDDIDGAKITYTLNDGLSSTFGYFNLKLTGFYEEQDEGKEY